MMSDLPPGDTAGEALDEVEVDLENPEAEEAELDEADAGLADEGDAGDDGEGQSEAGPQGQARDVARPGRGPRGRSYGEQIRALEAGRAADKAEFERQLQQLLSERRQPTAAEQAAAAEQERQRLEMMSPAEIGAYYHQKTLNEVSQQTQRMQVQLWDQGDRREYEALLERTPNLRRFEDKVLELQRQAPGVSRRYLLATAIGLKAIEQAPAARTRATNAAETGRTRNRVSPSQARGDVASERGRRGDSLEERLRGQAI